jgi:phosphoribosylformylglycinamidine cyclo-ligase
LLYPYGKCDEKAISMNATDNKTTTSLTYADAGVDIDAGNALVEQIKPAVASTHRAGVMGSIGGFGGLFDLAAAGYKDALLVGATDGVGTKLKLAHTMNDHSTIGIDLVAMCVNDLLAQNAEPLFFLDYYACGGLDTAVAVQVIEGIAKGCKDSGCALIGGETAEMPGMYAKHDYDLAGFVVGAVPRDALLPRKQDIIVGDVILGIASSGVHSNGFSLVRKIIDHAGVSYHDVTPWDAHLTYGQALLEPTRLYVTSCLPVMRNHTSVKAFAHITGGGLTENLPRVFGEGLTAEINRKAWVLPALFAWLQQAGGVSDAEMLKTFNCGIGGAFIVAANDAEAVQKALEDAGETVYKIGTVVKGDKVSYT